MLNDKVLLPYRERERNYNIFFSLRDFELKIDIIDN